MYLKKSDREEKYVMTEWMPKEGLKKLLIQIK